MASIQAVKSVEETIVQSKNRESHNTKEDSIEVIEIEESVQTRKPYATPENRHHVHEFISDVKDKFEEKVEKVKEKIKEKKKEMKKKNKKKKKNKDYSSSSSDSDDDKKEKHGKEKKLK
ncbi:hypothetical protein QJS04_geneDACA011088 [Acorus gramineus]|uniref:Uncharacterized protein n=1 Tax=Acorus gramineus TaxID=55184 RepID=A0AAV9BJ41_ACOGR|nr:hypothetical protein QJS04_geneDACA011088 [Acorus gramineus]